MLNPPSHNEVSVSTEQLERIQGRNSTDGNFCQILNFAMSYTRFSFVTWQNGLFHGAVLLFRN
jgi:hypothetical protein